jgi:DNA-binding NarL/FixJ family response regulator
MGAMEPIAARITVAMVDDDPAVRERVREALSRDPALHFVAEFADAQGALAWLGQQTADVLLVDLGLPDLPGLAVITYCAQRHPGTDIMVLTVFDDADKVLQSIKAGASGYLLKDSVHDEIVVLVKQLRAGGAPMTPSIARLLLQQVRPAVTAKAAPPTALPGVRLTPAEDNVLNHVARGFKSAEIAQLSGVTIHTVHTHIKNIYAKLSVSSRSEAVFEASRLGLLDKVFPRSGGD